MTSAASSQDRGQSYTPAAPSDRARRIMWRYDDDEALANLVTEVRRVARGPVAELIASGGRHEASWDDRKAAMIGALDQAGVPQIAAADCGEGPLAGRANLAAALTALELGWVDGGAAACVAALRLAATPVALRGTDEQRSVYATSSDARHGAFCLTEPLPFAGVDTGSLAGRVSVADWPEGQEPILRVEKRGRFTSNMEFADYVVATVTSEDPRIQGSCMVILEPGDEGTFERGGREPSLVDQIVGHGDPVFELRVPANRIVGGYRVEDGVIVPNYNHIQLLQVVLGRTRIPVGVATAAKLLSAVEPIVRYQRERFGEQERSAAPSSPQGLQVNEDALYRLIDIWASGEAGASIGLAAARAYDALDVFDQQRDEIYAVEGVTDRSQRRAARQQAARLALDYLHLGEIDKARSDEERLVALKANRLVQWLLHESVAHVLSPAAKLFNATQGASMMREALCLMGGQGLTSDCPGFLPYKWLDAQVEAMHEGPESVHRRHLATAMTNELFLTQLGHWLGQMRKIASDRPGTGACTVASALDLWLWTLRHLQDARDADGRPVFREQRQGATFAMADALSWLLASYQFVLDVVALAREAATDQDTARKVANQLPMLTDLCHIQAARAGSVVGATCAELVFGYQRHPTWDDACHTCFRSDEIDALEGIIPGIAAGARITGDVLEEDGSHAEKAGPCVRFGGLHEFVRRRNKLDGCLTGCRLAKDQAAATLTRMVIAERPEYPPSPGQ